MSHFRAKEEARPAGIERKRFLAGSDDTQALGPWNVAPLALLVYSRRHPVAELGALLQEYGVSTPSCFGLAQLPYSLEMARPQLVFTDLELTDGNWLDVLKTVSTSLPRCKVIVVGHTLDNQWELTVQDHGAYGYVAPPFERLPLQLLVSSALKSIPAPNPSFGKLSAA